jgi:hypothetical protein
VTEIVEADGFFAGLGFGAGGELGVLLVGANLRGCGQNLGSLKIKSRRKRLLYK